MTEPHRDYRAEITASLTPVRPLASPSRRVWLLAPLGLVLAASSVLFGRQRGDLTAFAPLVTWGLTALQAFAGLWLLSLAFREAVPGRNLSRRALLLALGLTALLVGGVTAATYAASPTMVPASRVFQYWYECVAGPMALGAPFMIVATLMSARAFPTRPAIAGALCGLSAGVIADSGWRLGCWFSDPAHVISAHALAIAGLAAAGAVVGVFADRTRWKRG